MRLMRFFLASLLLFSTALHSQDVIEEIVAIVNDDIITLSEYRTEYEANYQALRSQLQGEEFARQLELMRKGLLNQMITDVLLLQEADKMEGLNVEEQMKLYIDNLKKENNIESDEEFIRILRQQGSDYNEWREILRRNMMKEAVVVANVHQSIVVDEAEVLNYHKLHPDEFTEPAEYKLKGIIVSSGSGSDEGVEATKQEISRKIAAGEDFGALAGEYSEGPEKDANGNLGVFKRGELARNLEEAVENLKEGEVTPWIQMRNAWYILKLEEKKEPRVKEFDEARKDIEQRIFAEKAEEKFKEFMKELREKSYIKILDPNPLDF